MARRYDLRRVKIHRTYTTAEAASLVGAHKETVGRWIAAGLPTIDKKRPLLIQGGELRAFLRAREPRKQPCRPGEFYCLPCRAPKRPALEMTEYIPRTNSRGMLRGICPTCEKLIHRAVNLATIDRVRGGAEVAFPAAKRRLDDSSCPLSNADLR
jgi:hypothetical protein